MIYVVFYSSAGVPATGLAPTIDLYQKVSDATGVTPAPTVSEIGGGFYKFTANPAEALVVRMNGGGTLAEADKYKVMQITPHDGDLDAQVSTRGSQEDLTAVKARTDNLPNDPASNAQVNTRLAAADYTAPDNTGISAIKSKTENLPSDPADQSQVETAITLAVSGLAAEANVQVHVAEALATYDPPTKAELDAAVSPLALEAGIEAHVLAVLNYYDLPTRAEASNDKDAVLAAIAALNDISVGELLAGDISDLLSFPANSLADLVRKLFWVVCNRLVINEASGAFTAYQTDGVTPAAAGTITDNGATTARSDPTWL
jgi:hypothetical protein